MFTMTRVAIAIKLGFAPAPLILPDDNAAFNDEGLSADGWGSSNASLSSSGGFLRQTKTADGASSNMTSPPLTFPPANCDWILYGSVRAAINGIGVIWMLNGAQEVSIWFGTTAANTAITGGAVSICGTTSAGFTRNTATCATGLSYDTVPVVFALQYDSKFDQLACWFRQSDGSWKLTARVPCDWFSATNIQVLSATAAPAGAWVEFDYLTLCRPNIISIGDSICEGKNLFSPNRTLGLNNDESSWQRHAPLFPTTRNNLIVNKGVGSETSAQILSRIGDATNESPRIVIVHASSNDEASSISQSTRTSNIQSTINAIVSAGQQAILLNAMYGTASGSDNTPTPDLRNYMTAWWSTNASTLSGNYLPINIMTPIADESEFMRSELTQSDGIHPNINGYIAIGRFIADALSDGDPFFGNTSLLFNMDDNFTDISRSPKTISSFGGVAISSDESKYGGKSLLLNGTDAYISIPADTDFSFGNGDFTVEMWVNRNSIGTEQCICSYGPIGQSTAFAPLLLIRFNANNTLQAYVGESTTATAIFGNLTSVNTFTNTTDFHHIAYTRAGSVFRLFVDGLQQAFGSQSGTQGTDPTSVMVFGRDVRTNGAHLSAHLDDIRITKGVARYIADFIPPAKLVGHF